MAEGFFISDESGELRKAVLIMASHAKGGIHEWLEMDCDEFLLWLNTMKKLNHV